MAERGTGGRPAEEQGARSPAARPSGARRLLPWALTVLRRAAWAPLGVFLGHGLLSIGLEAYDAIPWTDVPMHLLGGIAIAYFFARAYEAGLELDLLGRPSGALRPVVVFLATCAAALAWEHGEFLSDRYLGTHSQRGLEDTLLDMLLGVVGGLVYLGLDALAARKDR